MSQTNSENTITVQELIEERGHDQVQIEFNEQVYRDSEGLLVVQDLE